MIIKLLIATFLITISLSASTIKVAVAANVSYAIKDLVIEFNKTHPDIKVNITLGGSGKLTAQITHGAPYEIFMSADLKYPDALYKNGLALNQPIVYAEGGVVFLSVKERDFSSKFELLKDDKIKKIAIANPKLAPYGKATVEAMKSVGVYESVKKKFVYGESISQTLSYALRAADIGLVAKSSLFSPKMKRFKKGLNWSDVDPKLYTSIKQGIVILKNADTNTDVKAFYDFILSKSAKEIFQKFGYIVR
jgi:molybdate transport system substrate-binding protein